MSGTFCRNLWQSEGRAEGTLSTYSVPSGERTRDMLLPSPLVQGIEYLCKHMETEILFL